LSTVRFKPRSGKLAAAASTDLKIPRTHISSCCAKLMYG
jgi:hypothetical protein